MKKIFEFIKDFPNFVKNNVFLIFAAYWFISFLIGFITIDPSALDDTTRKIKALELGSALIWTLVFMLEHTVTKVVKALSEEIDLVNKRVDIICDAITEAINASKEDKEAADKDEKDEKEEKEVN